MEKMKKNQYLISFRNQRKIEAKFCKLNIRSRLRIAVSNTRGVVGVLDGIF